MTQKLEVAYCEINDYYNLFNVWLPGQLLIRLPRLLRSGAILYGGWITGTLRAKIEAINDTN